MTRKDNPSPNEILGKIYEITRKMDYADEYHLSDLAEDFTEIKILVGKFKSADCIPSKAQAWRH